MILVVESTNLRPWKGTVTCFQVVMDFEHRIKHDGGEWMSQRFPLICGEPIDT